MSSIYDRLIIHARSWTQDKLYKSFRSLAFNTPYEQLETLFGKELNSNKEELVETEKVIQKAKDRITTMLQIELCLKHLVCPKCAGNLSKAICQTKDKVYWDVYQCQSCSFTTKRSSNHAVDLAVKKAKVKKEK